jgi:ubiquinone/menaquinone biosynthesis C-methylase UbiE/DNA-binding transcriptional ArsR family regulator
MLAATSPPLLHHLAALGDLTRSRLLLLLERHELTVGELCTVLQLPQSTVSRHLKVLADEGWVRSRAEGTSRRYRIADALDAPARRLWHLVRDEIAGTTAARQDATRARSVLARRRRTSQRFFSSAAGRWDRLRAELFGPHPELPALLALLDPDWTVGDLGCGTGQVSERLAPFVGRIIAVDESSAMLAAARRRLAERPGVEIRPGELDALPIDDAELDVALLVLVLHYLPEPGRALAEAHRTLRPGGRLLVIDMMPHTREEYRHTMGHLWLGFSAEQLTRWLRDSGFHAEHHIPLPPDPSAKGPNLFAMSATR